MPFGQGVLQILNEIKKLKLDEEDVLIWVKTQVVSVISCMPKSMTASMTNCLNLSGLHEK